MQTDFTMSHLEILNKIKVLENAYPLDDLQELSYLMQISALKEEASLVRKYAKEARNGKTLRRN